MTLSTIVSDTEVATYEAELAQRLGVDHVVALSSGTAALQCALDAVGVKPGDEVLVPALSVVMSAAPVRHLGAIPVFVDCTPDGSDFDYDDLQAKVTDRTTAMLPVYLWGRAGDETRARVFAEDRGLALVADACQALGTTVGHPAPAGPHYAGETTTLSRRAQAGIRADIGCFSTHRLKLLSTYEGGFLTTNNPTGPTGLALTARTGRAPPVGRRRCLGSRIISAWPPRWPRSVAASWPGSTSCCSSGLRSPACCWTCCGMSRTELFCRMITDSDWADVRQLRSLAGYAAEAARPEQLALFG